MFQTPSNLSTGDLRISDSEVHSPIDPFVIAPITFAFFFFLGRHPVLQTHGAWRKQSTKLCVPECPRRIPLASSREVCRWCGIKSKKEGCPEPNQSQGRKDREAAAGTGGLGVGWRGGSCGGWECWDAVQGARKQAGGRCMLLQASSRGHFPAYCSFSATEEQTKPEVPLQTLHAAGETGPSVPFQCSVHLINLAPLQSF